MGDDVLKTFCKHNAQTPKPDPIVCIFDRDKQEIVNEMSENGSHKFWGNNTYSLVLPIPSHRSNTPDLCIEMYYTDSEIKTSDENGRRLFFSKEFHPDSGKHLIIPELNSLKMNDIKAINKLSILDNGVFDANHKNIALTKNKFAQYVLAGEGVYGNFDPLPFVELFEIIESIASRTT